MIEDGYIRLAGAILQPHRRDSHRARTGHADAVLDAAIAYRIACRVKPDAAPTYLDTLRGLIQ